jgi:crotonobetainyl-CoA:carnitine CoA-transferase CaiB-like acyl-CoA transferase
MSDPAGPLAGVTVLEVGVFMATPYATMQLADLGARVLKVENPAAPDPVPRIRHGWCAAVSRRASPGSASSSGRTA